MSTPSGDSLYETFKAAGVNVANGTSAFSKIKFTVTDTSAAFLDLTGYSTESSDAILTPTIVEGAAASLTTAGFLRIKVTDSAGNLTDGHYYIPFGYLL